MPFQAPTVPRPNGMDTRVAKNHAEMVEMVHACKYVLMRLVPTKTPSNAVVMHTRKRLTADCHMMLGNTSMTAGLSVKRLFLYLSRTMFTPVQIVGTGYSISGGDDALT